MSYTAAVYPRFNGMYYTVRFPDFGDARVDNMDLDTMNDPKERDIQLQKSLRKLITKWKGPLPDPEFRGYDEFSSSYNDEIHYFKVTV